MMIIYNSKITKLYIIKYLRLPLRRLILHESDCILGFSLQQIVSCVLGLGHSSRHPHRATSIRSGRHFLLNPLSFLE